MAGTSLRVSWAVLVAATFICPPLQAQESAEEVQQAISRGGREWSSPPKARMLFENVSGGDRVWIWPLEDRLHELSRTTPRLTLKWRLQPGQRSIGASDEQLCMQVSGGSGNVLVGRNAWTFWVPVAGVRDDAVAGTLEIQLDELARHASSDTSLLLFLRHRDQTSRPLSNLLRIKVRIIDGESHYQRVATPSPDSLGWSASSFGDRGTRSILFSPDGKTLASADADGRVYIWDVATQQVRARSARTHDGNVQLDFSPDGTRLVSWSESDRTIRVWETTALRPIAEIRLAGRRSAKVATFVPESETLAILSGRVDRSMPGFSVWVTNTAEVLIWDLGGNKALGSMSAEKHGLAFSDITFSPDGKVMASWFGTDVQLWDVAQRTPVGGPFVLEPGAPVAGASFDTSSKALAMVDSKCQLTLWDLESRSRRVQATFAPDPNVAFVNLTDGETLVFGDGRGTVFLWDVFTGKPRGSPLSRHPDGVSKGVVSNGKKIVAAGTSRHVVIWDALEGREVGYCVTDGPALPPDQWSLAISPDGDALAIARHDRGVTLCRARNR